MSRAPIIATLFMLAVLLSGCSALRFGYNQAPELAYWWLDAYADFDDAQTQRVREGLSRWFAWHRRTQLQDYADLLVRMRSEVPAPTTAQRACGWWDEARRRIDVAVEHGVPIAADLVTTLSTDQLRHIERRYAKVNSTYRDEYLQPDPADRLRAATKRTVERAESFYGRLDEPQRQLIERRVAQSPFDPDLWFAERQRRQQDALQTLQRLNEPGAKAAREAVEAALRGYAARVERSPSEGYRRYADQLQQFNCDFAAALHNSTTAAQRQVAARRLRGWEADLRALAADVPH